MDVSGDGSFGVGAPPRPRRDVDRGADADRCKRQCVVRRGNSAAAIGHDGGTTLYSELVEVFS